MKLSFHLFRVCCAILPFSFFSHPVEAGQYFQDFSGSAVGATNFADGAQLFCNNLGGPALVVDANTKELLLTDNINDFTRSAFMLPDLDPGVPVYAFSAKWNTTVYGNFPSAADGFSFNFGNLAGLDLASSSYEMEKGYNTGLSFCVQTYGNPGFYLRANGTVVASSTNNPTTQWGVTNFARHFFEMDWNYTNGVTVRMDGQTIFANVIPYGFSPAAGSRFVLAARTGALTEEVRVDNIVVMTGGNLQQIPMTSPYYKSSEFTNANQTADKAFDNLITTKWLALSPTGHVGATCSNGSLATLVYVLTSGEDLPGRDPRIWTLEGSNNGGTNWATCGSGSGYFLNRNETRAWLATNNSSFAAFRLNITANNGDSILQLSELRLYQFNAVSVGSIAWGQTSASSQAWEAIASSSSGQVLAGVFRQNTIMVSTNYGATWAARSAPGGTFRSVTSSASGSKLAVAGYYNVSTSTDYGQNWTTKLSNPGPPTGSPFFGVASSADGNKLVAVEYFKGIHSSTNGGATWNFFSSVRYWLGAASSSDGNKMAVIEQNEVWTSTNSGTNWTQTSAPLTINAPNQSIASSADGTKLVVAHGNGGILASINSGATWSFTGAPNILFGSVAMSSDGTKLVAAANYGLIYISTNSGTTWQATASPNANWAGVTSSSDGSKLAAAAYGGGVWTNYVSPPSAPAVTTSSATFIGVAGATLNANVVPNFLNSTVRFQWGTTTNYGNTSATQTTGSIEPTSVGISIGGLSPSTTYHFRAVTMNNFGTNYGSDMTFTTLASNMFFNIAHVGDSITGSSTNWPGPQEPSRAIDSTASSKYLNFDTNNTGFTVHPSITNVPVRAIGLISAEDAPERDPTSFALYGSQNGTQFTLIASNTVPLFAGRNAIQSFAFANTNTYAAYKIVFPTVANPTSANSMQIAEVEFLPYSDITSTNDTPVLTLPPGASLNGVGPASSLVDRLLSGGANKLVVLDDTNNVVALITPAAGTSVLKGFEFIGGNDDATYPGRTPATLAIEGSNDGTNFVSLSAVTLQLTTANMQVQGFSVLGNTNSYTKYRATFGAPQSGNVLQIGELRLFGVTSTKINVSASGNSMLLSWPASGFVLQQNTNLTSTNWVAATNALTVTNGQTQATSPLPSDNKFYRLKAQ